MSVLVKERARGREEMESGGCKGHTWTGRLLYPLALFPWFRNEAHVDASSDEDEGKVLQKQEVRCVLLSFWSLAFSSSINDWIKNNAFEVPSVGQLILQTRVTR